MRKKDNYGTPVNNQATEAMANLDPSLVSYLLDNAANSSNVEEFISKLMVGECQNAEVAILLMGTLRLSMISLLEFAWHAGVTGVLNVAMFFQKEKRLVLVGWKNELCKTIFCVCF